MSKSRKRGDGIKLTGIAIDEALLDEIGALAKDQYRSRNNMIELMLREQVAKYRAKKKRKTDD